MKFFQEITLLPGVDIDINFLWQKAFKFLHLALVGLKNSEDLIPVGISFPEYEEKDKKLGTKIRLFAPNQEILAELDISNKLKSLSDYLHITSIRNVPTGLVKQHALFSRWRSIANPERLARRRAKRQGVSLEQAMEHFKDYKTDISSAPPYIATKSLSNNNDFRLYISMKKVSEPSTGLFSCYGLSTSERTPPATVPLF